MENYEDYINKMIEDGYWSKRDLSPIKCDLCESENLEDINYSFENAMIVSYDRCCKKCKKIVGSWSYGHWDI